VEQTVTRPSVAELGFKPSCNLALEAVLVPTILLVLKNRALCQAPVALICNPSYMGG
jgi:hypothetical protein